MKGETFVVLLGTSDVHRLCRALIPAGRSLGPFVEETLKPGGKHCDFGWNHGRHVLFAFGLEALNDGSEFRGQLLNADRFVLLENSIVDLFPDALRFDLGAVLVLEA